MKTTENTEIFDFTNLTCTNLMIKLKILTKKMGNGDQIKFHTTREGNDNIKKIFSKNGFQYSFEKLEPNKFQSVILKL